MRHRAIIVAISAGLLQACASSAPPVNTGDDIVHLSDADALECRIEGLMYQDLARSRDAGQPIVLAENRIETRYRALAGSVDERAAIDTALARRNEFATFAYSHVSLLPSALRETGSRICELRASGSGAPSDAVALGNAAVACQKLYPAGTPSAEAAFKTCLSNETAKLVRR